MARIFSSGVSSVYRVIYKQYAYDNFSLEVKVAANNDVEALKKVKESCCCVTNFNANNDGYVVSVEKLEEFVLV